MTALIAEEHLPPADEQARQELARLILDRAELFAVKPEEEAIEEEREAA